MSSILANLTDQWSDGKRLHVTGTLAFTGSYTLGGLTLDFGIAEVRSSTIPKFFIAPFFKGYNFEYVPLTTSGDGLLKVRVGAGLVAATGTLTSDNTNVTTLDTVTIGGQVYTFKTALTASTTAYQVLIGGSADATLLNLIRAINGTGTPGTDYGSLTPVNTSVSAAASVTAHAFAVTALVSGSIGNLIATTEASSHLSWGAATLASGADPVASGVELAATTFPTSLSGQAVPFYAIFEQFI